MADKQHSEVEARWRARVNGRVDEGLASADTPLLKIRERIGQEVT